MEIKKSHKANLERRRKSFLMIGFAIAISFILMAFEWTSPRYKISTVDTQKEDANEIFEMPLLDANWEIERAEELQPEETAIEEVNHEIIAIVEDLVEELTEVEDAEIATPEVPKISPPTQKKYTNFEDTESKEFTENDDTPTYLGENIEVPYYNFCKDASRTEKVKCISKEVHKSINEGMSNISSNQIEDNESNKMYVQFVIGKTGHIEDIEIANEKLYNKQIIKLVINSLKKVPAMKPALKNGQPVRVIFQIPIKFSVQ